MALAGVRTSQQVAATARVNNDVLWRIQYTLAPLTSSDYLTMDAPRPGLQNPIEGTTFDTDPSTLHLQEGNEGPSSKVVDRLLRKTSQAKRSTHRKLHSLSRKSRTSQDNQGQCRARWPRRASYVQTLIEKLKGIEKDAFSQDNEVQFLESDLNSSSRPSLTSLTFRGEGSVRVDSALPGKRPHWLLCF